MEQLNEKLLPSEAAPGDMEEQIRASRTPSFASQPLVEPDTGFRWRQLMPRFWVGVILVVVFGFLPWGIYELHHKDQERHVQAWFVAGVFVCLAIPITVWDIAEHFRHFCDPPLQKLIIRILWMVPIYCLDAFFALRFVKVYIYLDAVRECYEAYVIYNFYVYLLTFLRKRDDFDLSLTRRGPQHHVFPMCCLKPWRMGQTFIDSCTHGVTSYILVRPLLALVIVICELTDTYDEGHFNFTRGYLYVAVINSASQAWAMYCLVLFYLAFKDDLKPINPVAKFLVIKAVIFFSFWQSVVIGVLGSAGVIKDDPTWTTYNKDRVSSSIQDFLICIEMFIASIVHHRVFSYREHMPPELQNRHRLGFQASLRELFDVSDVRDTVYDHLTTVTSLGGRINIVAARPTAPLNSNSALRSAYGTISPSTSALQENPVVLDESRKSEL
eukprot:m.66775 g.66775  ORF g.66775 m.66775 type:complete len:441 (+) comp14069_c0_seq1:148-1470(+)